MTLREIVSKKYPVGTGRAPALNRIAQVKRGDKIAVNWALNNHGGPVRFYWEGVGPLSTNAPEPDYEAWRSSRNLLVSHPYRESATTRCSTFTINQGPVGVIMGLLPNAGGGPGYGGISEMKTCWGVSTII